ncbi:hypothetical protein ACFSE0_10675 [Ochrobactrum teleogrylli]|uniref:Uncharacterized protein n=1 Tax=Ochrobactrum teleogrylli TaxID=2479765 RepID=A0ABY2Y7P9_9HYPH|nr:hypothetical protein [[Ochrobactrum] teleogrylli]TNV17759.1 hypothetical protein FIC94_06180 [[Ochrobactrum] teleogrylli]
MTTENEKFYDDIIAPRLHQLAEECKQRGMSFVANVEYDPGATASTILLAENSGYHARLMCTAAQCGENVDGLIFAIMKHAREHGHSSLCLKMLGVSPTPDQETVQ